MYLRLDGLAQSPITKAALSCGVVYYAVQGGSNFRVSGCNHKV